MAKTLKQIEARLQAYKKGTVDSPYRVKTPTSYDPSFGVMEPGVIDCDFHFHGQCMDLIVDYVLWLTDNKFRTWGNAKDAINNKRSEEHTSELQSRFDLVCRLLLEKK